VKKPVYQRSPLVVQYTPEEGTLPKGWKLEYVKRSTGKHVDRYWHTVTDKKLRSKVEVYRFLQYLEETDGNEDDAFDLLRGKQINKSARKKLLASVTQTDKRRRSGVEENASDTSDDEIKSASKDIGFISDEDNAESLRESKRRKSNAGKDVPGTPDTTKDMISNDKEYTAENPEKTLSNKGEGTMDTSDAEKMPIIDSSKKKENDISNAEAETSGELSNATDSGKNETEPIRKRQTRRQTMDEKIDGEKHDSSGKADDSRKRSVRKRTSLPTTNVS